MKMLKSLFKIISISVTIIILMTFIGKTNAIISFLW